MSNKVKKSYSDEELLNMSTKEKLRYLQESIDSMSDKEFKDYLEKSGFVVKEVNVNNIEEERELGEISKEVLCLREALKHACDVFAYHTGSCPYDKYDSCQLPGSCEDQYSACWWKYFISKASKGAADSE